MEADGLLATCLQHEIDHLNGVLFIDHLSRLKRDRVVKKFVKKARRDEPAGLRTALDAPETHDAAHRLHGHAGFRRADAGRDRRPGPRGRRPSTRARRRRPGAAWS